MTPTCRRAPGNHRGSRIPPGSAGLCWLLLSFAGAAPVLAEEAPRPLLLAPCDSRETALQGQAQPYSQQLEAALHATGRFAAATGGSPTAAAGPAPACPAARLDRACWVRQGTLAGAQRLVTSELWGEPPACMVTVHLLELPGGRVLRKVQDTYNCRIEDLLARVEHHGRQLADLPPLPGATTHRGVTLARSPATPAAGPTLQLSTEPAGADVYLDGELRGKAPLTLSGLAPGEHSLVLVREGYADLVKGLLLPATGTVTVQERLVAATGGVKVTSVPVGAQVEIGGQARGVTPLTVRGLAAGTQVVRLLLAGHPPWESRVEVKAGALIEVVGRLGGKDGKVIFSSVPAKAKVFVDERERGTTPLTLALPPGSHRVRFEKDGHGPQERELLLQPGEARSLSVTLARQATPAAGVVAGHELTLFTPEARAFDARDERFLREAEALGFKLDRRHYPSNPEGNIKVARGNRALAERVQALVRKHHGKELEIRETFSEGDRDVFVNLGSDTPTEDLLSAVTGPVVPKAAPNGFEVTLFTPDKRPRSPADDRLLSELEAAGFRIDRGSYASNPDANVKVPQGKRTLGEQVLQVVRRYYQGDFPILEVFGETETDVFINLGQAVPVLDDAAVEDEAATDEDDRQPNVVVFTPGARPFNDADRRLLETLRGLGLSVQETPGGGGSNPESSIKVATGRAFVGERIRPLLQRCYDQPFPVKELFEPGSDDVFVNLGEQAAPLPGCTMPALAAEATQPPASRHRVVVFTPGARPFTEADRTLLTELRTGGFEVQERPGGGGSNEDPNIKVGKGKLALGIRVQEVARGCYDQPFQVKELFDEDDTDIYLNLGARADERVRCGSPPGPGEQTVVDPRDGPRGAPPRAIDPTRYRIRFFTPDSRPLGDGELELQERLRRMGFRVEQEPLAASDRPNIKVGSDQIAAGERVQRTITELLGRELELKPAFNAGDGDIFVTFGGEGEEELEPDRGALPEEVGTGAAALLGRELYSQFTVLLFTPGSRPLNASDDKILRDLKALGFQVVDDRSGGGGSNEESNVKVGRGFGQVGNIVRRVAQRCYDQPFPLLEAFEPGDTDIYINLGADADRKTRCGKTRL